MWVERGGRFAAFALSRYRIEPWLASRGTQAGGPVFLVAEESAVYFSR